MIFKGNFQLLAESGGMSRTEGVIVAVLCVLIVLFLLADVVLVISLHKMNANLKIRSALVGRKSGDGEKKSSPDSEIRTVIANDGEQKNYDFSFSARLNQADESVQVMYGRLKNALLTYTDMRDFMAWEHETFSVNGTVLAKISISGERLTISLAANPESPKLDGVKFENVSSYEMYATVPVRLVVDGPQMLSTALNLIYELASALRLTRGAERNDDYREQKRSVEMLELLGLIR